MTLRQQVQEILQALQMRSINVGQAASKLTALNLKSTVPTMSCYTVARDFAAGFLSYNDAYTALGV